LLRYFRRHRGPLIAVAVLTLATAAMTALQPWPLKLLADNALGGKPAPHWLRSVLGIVSLTPTHTTLVVVAAVGTLFIWISMSVVTAAMTWLYGVIGQRIMYDIAGDLFRSFQRRSLLSHNQRSLGDSLSRLGVDTRTFCLSLSVFFAPARQVITLLVIAALSFELDPVLAAILFSVTPATAVTARAFGPRLKQRATLGREAQSKTMSFVHQTLQSIPVVQSFTAERRNAIQLRRLADDAVTTVRKLAAVNSLFGSVGNGTLALATALVMFVGALRVHDGVLSIGSLLVFFTYGRMVQRQVADLIVSYGRFKEAVASADRVLEVLEEEPDVRDAPHAQAPVGRAAGEVRLEGVTFGYEPGRPVLEGVSVGADPGEAVALVGHTGAGKSTLVSLIPRFFDPWSGRVTVDRHDVRDLTLASVRAQISVVLQEPFLLPLSVAENIAYGRPGASPREVVAAAVAAQADEFIRALPDGYETVIDERGASLSGGERQRLAIARALLKDAPILILDEPTSALDSETEASLLQALERLIEGRTTFVIAHRLSTVRRCNRIVVLDHGRIAEIGSHNELANAGGIYQRVHLLQMGFDTNQPLDERNQPPAECKQSPATFPRQRTSRWRMRWIWRRAGRERRPTT
jgi:ATP-binding cassette subfamily B protein/subfamily B ATP-binding cassette protein MsbA